MNISSHRDIVDLHDEECLMRCRINQSQNLRFEWKGRKIGSPVETEAGLRSNRPVLTLMQNSFERGSIEGTLRRYRHHIRCPPWRSRYPCRGQKVVRWILGSSGNLQIVLNTRIKGDSQWSTARGVVFGNERFSMTDQVDLYIIATCGPPVTYVCP